MGRNYQEIHEILRNELAKLQREYWVEALWLFGSYIKNQQNVESDVDILVSFSRPPSLLKFIRLENYLTDLLGIKVDLVMRNALKPEIGRRILEEAIEV